METGQEQRESVLSAERREIGIDGDPARLQLFD
jgi:hypothetical protein